MDMHPLVGQVWVLRDSPKRRGTPCISRRLIWRAERRGFVRRCGPVQTARWIVQPYSGGPVPANRRCDCGAIGAPNNRPAWTDSGQGAASPGRRQKTQVITLTRGFPRITETKGFRRPLETLDGLTRHTPSHTPRGHPSWRSSFCRFFLGQCDKSSATRTKPGNTASAVAQRQWTVGLHGASDLPEMFHGMIFQRMLLVCCPTLAA